MIRVAAASRLHFGLLSLPAWEPPAARTFGGVGLMVAGPGIRLCARPAPAWAAEGPLAERALALAARFTQALTSEGVAPPPTQHLLVEAAAPEHAGLGTGTQLALAVAQVLATAAHLDKWGPAQLAMRVARGERSALGVHGFTHGGFLVEGGHGRLGGPAPLVARLGFPPAWRVVLVLRRAAQGLHGLGERQAFERLAQQPPALARTDSLCRLVLLGLLPALAEADLPAFGEALYEFNRLVGEAFRPVQGGTYSHPCSAEVVTFVRRQGVAGVGQSSWGPALFAVVADPERGEDLAHRLRQQLGCGADEVLVTAAANEGARLTVEPTL
jgi:beta-RFAP synthase